METLAARIERVRKDLTRVQQELTRGAAWKRSAVAEQPCAADAVDLASIQALKSSVDEMRQFLWWFMQELALGSGENAQDSLQNFRLYRATEMLQSLGAQMAQAGSVGKSAEARGFVDAVQSFATAMVDRHMEEPRNNLAQSKPK